MGEWIRRKKEVEKSLKSYSILDEAADYSNKEPLVVLVADSNNMIGEELVNYILNDTGRSNVELYGIV